LRLTGGSRGQASHGASQILRGPSLVAMATIFKT